MDTTDAALSFFAEGFACSQSVLLAFAPRFGLDPVVAARVASAFGGGIARQGGICGAVSGAAMVLGLHAGNATAEDRPAKEAMYAAVRTLMAQFAEAHGSVECRRLIGRDMSTPEGYAAAREAGVFTRTCPAFVRTAVALALSVVGAGLPASARFESSSAWRGLAVVPESPRNGGGQATPTAGPKRVTGVPADDCREAW